jgi:hypothetical protein
MKKRFFLFFIATVKMAEGKFACQRTGVRGEAFFFVVTRHGFDFLDF